MFDIGWSEMVFVAIIAVLVIGPKDLPGAIAAVGKYVRKIKGFAREFQSGIDDLAREAELDDLKKTVSGDQFNIKKQVEDAVDPTGDFSKAFEDVKPDIREDTPSNETSGAASSSTSSEDVEKPQPKIGITPVSEINYDKETDAEKVSAPSDSKVS
ncbi:Sec-independent protein translocase protein TatB [Sneathiella limimaris]|uniref:Sec-independent protein translocase protein TatB n=1 Tax=Sneathiella limimaris TaxID=1964213 RepID=UPI00146F248F|nr:Sec-independent protein translocase protein TatB [Sneathiella limimaris]